MMYRPNSSRAERIRIQDSTEAHIRFLFHNLPHPKPTDKQKQLATRRIQASVDKHYLDTISD
ncbi:hypothetical protein [Vitreoscilla stercoraria]|uniref:Uncharacterized protein n=1 Tax=Vitreoscilla stercoraria TaxID=61 RepID=A0ABY4ECQ9_VITST|nr:hypothetical protein [Vitreoscilla stercoraria]UOO93533.1 hypothetical protein LVJ81_05775 [Vitreoscilla stercoraria]